MVRADSAPALPRWAGYRHSTLPLEPVVPAARASPTRVSRVGTRASMKSSQLAAVVAPGTRACRCPEEAEAAVVPRITAPVQMEQQVRVTPAAQVAPVAVVVEVQARPAARAPRPTIATEATEVMVSRAASPARAAITPVVVAVCARVLVQRAVLAVKAVAATARGVATRTTTRLAPRTQVAAVVVLTADRQVVQELSSFDSSPRLRCRALRQM